MSIPSQEYIQSTVPASIPASPAMDTGQQSEKIFSSNQADLQRLATAAATPVAGGHANQVPLSMMRPDSPYTTPSLDHLEVVGAGNARAQGIANSVKSVASLLSNVEIAKQNKTKTEVASATQQLLTAQTGYDQAKQVLAQDPNNADAKAAMERNKASMNGILSNDKLRKQIAKGFNIDFTDPQANKTLEHEGVAQGKEMAKAHMDYAEQFNQRTPVQMGPNEPAQARYSAALAQEKIKQTAMKDYMNFQASVYRSDRTVDAAKVRAIGSGILQAASFQHQQDMLNQRFAQAEKLRGEHFTDSVKLIYERAGAARQTAADIFKDKESDPLNMYTKTRTAAETYAKNAINDGNTLVALQQARLSQYVDSKGTPINEKNVNQQAVKDIDAQIQYVKQQQQIDQANSKNFLEQATRLRNTFGLAETPQTEEGGASNTQSDSVGGGDPDYTDPLYYSNSEEPQ